MKLVIDLRLINASGIGTYLKNVVPGILGSFDKVIVLGNSFEIKKLSWSNNVEVVEFNAKIYSAEEQFSYPFIIPKCDVFWAPLFNVPLFPIRAEKIVCTIHDVNQLTGIAPLNSLKKKYAGLLIQNAVRKSSLILTVSEFSKSEIIKFTGVNPEKIDVVYCGVDEKFFKGKSFSSALKLPENYILYVGNVKPHKNLKVLLKAYAQLSDSLKSIYKLLIVGKKEGFITGDSEIDSLIERYNLQDNIVFTGYVEDKGLPYIYQNASLFVFPSLYEGFGLPVLEALSAGTPVISSNAASLPEVGGKAVIYFNPDNETELSEKIKIVLENPEKKELLLENVTMQLEKFSWEKSVQNHSNAFKNILK